MRRAPRYIRTGVALAAFVALTAACGGSGAGSSSSTTSSPFKLGGTPGTITWPAPADPMARARAAGLVPETAERLRFHVHAHLDVFVGGKALVVPAGLGIDTKNPGVHQFETLGRPSYGGISGCDTACISPLHTHDVTGILHTESATKKYNTLGQLFVEWGVRLDAKCVQAYCSPATSIAVYVNGTRQAGDPRTIELTNGEEIAVVIGPPPATIPSTGDFSQA